MNYGFTPVQDNQVYFAADSAENLADNCLKKAGSFYNTMRSNMYLDTIVKMWRYYHGIFNDQLSNGYHEITFAGQEGELAQLPVNHFRNIAEHIKNMILADRPVIDCQSINTDAKSISQAYLADDIVNYYMRQKGLEERIQECTSMAIVLGSSFLRMEWNATAGEMVDFDPETGEKAQMGEIEFTTLSPFDVVFDGTKEYWNNDWLIVRSYKNRYDLAAKYPEFREKILGLQTKSDSNMYRLSIFSNDQTDDIPVFEFYHRRTNALPDGRYTMFLASDIIPLDLPLPYREIPIYRVSAGEYMGTPYGYSPMFDIYPIQEALNSLYSTILTNQSAFGVQNLFVERGADIDFNSLEGAMNIIIGNKPPVPLQMTATPKEIFDFLGILVNAIETISGISSVTRGNPEASLKSGTALALVQSMSIQFISGLQKNYVKFVENVCTSLINILKDFAQTPQTVAVTGQSNKYMLKEFTGDDISSINRVMVSMGNPLSKTAAGRSQMAEQMLQMGLIKTPEHYFEVITTGEIKTMYEGAIHELVLIRSENELFLEGKGDLVMADLLDEHRKHIIEHRSVMANPEVRHNPELRKYVQNHIQEHINYLRSVDPDLLQLIGEQPLQAPMAPQAAPPTPGPQKGPEGNVPPPQGQNAQMASNPQQLMTGQGTEGGDMLPQPASPPAPFESLPTDPSQIQ
jgi:hypothetical protein